MLTMKTFASAVLGGTRHGAARCGPQRPAAGEKLAHCRLMLSFGLQEPETSGTVRGLTCCVLERVQSVARSTHYSPIESACARAAQRTRNMDMMNRTEISLFSGAALIAFALAMPASAAPAGSHQETCRDIQERNDQTIVAEC